MALPDKLEATGFLNPTLTVLGCFSTEVNGAQHNAHLNLRDYPGLAGWLLSILDHLLWQQGTLAGPRPIAEPPAGPTRQALIDAGILFCQRRPDGGLHLGINPGFGTQLMLDVRRRGERAHNTMLNFADDPDLTRWLLNFFANRSPGAADVSRLGPSLIASLRRHSVIVNEMPAADAYFPDPNAPLEFHAEFALASRVMPQRAGQPVPAEVRRLLGKHTPALPPGVDIAWAQDSGTGMVYPTICPPGTDLAAIEGVTGPGAAQRVLQWDREREAARQSVRTRRHAVLRDIVPSFQRMKLRRYVRQLRERGYFPALGDGQVALRASIHNQPTIASLHQGLAGIVNSINDEQVIPSYCYLSCYEEGSVLDRHLDRQQCAYNLCLVLDMRYIDRDGEPDPWPIYLELDGKPEPALLNVGDGIFFSGRSIYHWRDALPQGQRAVVCFYHFVPPSFTGSLD